MNKNYNCICGKTFGHQSSLSRHRKECPNLQDAARAIQFEELCKIKDKHINELEWNLKDAATKIDNLNIEIAYLKKSLEEKSIFEEKFFNLLDEERKDKQLIMSKSISAIEFLVKHLNNAPVLKEIDNFDIIKEVNGDVAHTRKSCCNNGFDRIYWKCFYD